MSTTRHRVVTGGGRGLRVSVAHAAGTAYQFDFYIPKNIWKLPVVEAFFDALAQLGGATIFDDEIGIWKGETEKTQVFRLVVRGGDLTRKTIRKRLDREVGALMAALSITKYAQEAILYTETTIRRCMASKATRIE